MGKCRNELWAVHLIITASSENPFADCSVLVQVSVYVLHYVGSSNPFFTIILTTDGGHYASTQTPSSRYFVTVEKYFVTDSKEVDNFHHSNQKMTRAISEYVFCRTVLCTLLISVLYTCSSPRCVSWSRRSVNMGLDLTFLCRAGQEKMKRHRLKLRYTCSKVYFYVAIEVLRQ